MAKVKKYQSNSGGHVRLMGVFADESRVIDLDAGEVYETEDKEEQAALDASPEVSAVDRKRSGPHEVSG